MDGRGDSDIPTLPRAFSGGCKPFLALVVINVLGVTSEEGPSYDCLSFRPICGSTLSRPRVINFKFLLQPRQKYYITQYEELAYL